MSAPGSVLTVNAGSSSLKFALFDRGSGLSQTLRGVVENLGEAPRLLARDAVGTTLAERQWPEETTSVTTIIDVVLDLVGAHVGSAGLVSVGHRVVHGGAKFSGATLVSPAVLDALEALTPLDPLHMPASLEPIRAIAEARPALPQIACFDTAFHRTMPDVATRFALPRAVSDLGLRRYGFHGLSFEFVAGHLEANAPKLSKGRVVVAHLGAGASLCALAGGVSIASSMGFSTLDGLVMATRCGALDPGALLYLARAGHSPSEIEDMLYHRSGLLGVSGISGDIRVLLASNDAHAREAIDLFTYRVALEVGSMASALGGLDGLIFTAGIGEHSPEIRAAICARLGWLGLTLDPAANAAGDGVISTGNSRIEARVVATNEEIMIARHAAKALPGADALQAATA